MKNQWMKITVLLVVLGLITGGPLAYAGSLQDRPRGGSECRKDGPRGFFKNLDLTSEQKEKLKTYRETEKTKNAAVREQLKAKMQALHEEIAKPAADRAKINAQVAEITTLKGQLFAQHIEGVLGMKEILTPEQFAKFEAGRKEHRFDKRGDWKKHPKKGLRSSSGESPVEGPDSV